MQASNVKIAGLGNDMQHLNGGVGNGAGTTFTWIGAAGGVMFSFISPAGADSHKRVNQGLSGAKLDGAGVAGKGINITSVNDLTLERVHIEGVTQDAVHTRCHNTGQLADAPDNQRMRFSGVTFTLAGDANGFNFGGSAVIPGGNTSLNVFEMCQGSTTNGIALLADNADNCNFIRCGFTCAVTGTNAIEIRGNGACGSLHFYNLTSVKTGSGAASIRILGTASGYPNNPIGNSFWMSDNSNGTQTPVADAGCTFVAVQDNGYSTGQRFGNIAVGSTAAGADAARNAQGSSTVVVHNPNSAHVKLIDNLSNEFGINIASTGNMRIARAAGTGDVEITGARLRANLLAPIVVMTAGGGVGGNEVVLVDATGGNRSISLPLASTLPTGRTPAIRIIRIDASANTVTVTRQGTDTLNAGTSETLAVGAGRTYVCNPATAAWYSI